MALQIGKIAIIADDLTGANDTALQFLLRGCNTQIVLDQDEFPEGCHNTVAWAINTESRLISPADATKRIVKSVKALNENLEIDFIYKKIDSTLRGNVAVESLALIEYLKWDAVIVVPAFPDEGRTTVGGYHLLRGVPLERTEVARDPNCPVLQSHIPTLLSHQCENNKIVGYISLSTVMKGAGPVLIELQEQIKQQKKLIVIDAVNNVDLEQIVLAMEKCLNHYKILPCGSAGLAQALTKAWIPDGKYQHIIKTLPKYPSFMVVGSATPITRSQVKLLNDYTEKFNLEIINLTPEQLINGITEEFVNSIVNKINEGRNIVVYTTPKEDSIQLTISYAESKNISKPSLSNIILDRIAHLTELVVGSCQVKLILVGGETANACCKAIKSLHLQLIDEVDYAIPLCLDQKAQFIITKSGNLGTPKTLVNIMNYLLNSEEDS